MRYTFIELAALYRDLDLLLNVRLRRHISCLWKNTRHVGKYSKDCNKGGPHKALWDYRGLKGLCPRGAADEGLL